MKRLLILLTLSIAFVLILCSCSDLGDEIDSGMEGLNDTLNEALKPVFKEDVKYTHEVGTDVGNICPTYNVDIFDKDGFTGKRVNVADTGKVTVINFWGVWCPYCVQEMPLFDQIATEYYDSVSFIAIHTNEHYTGDEGGLNYVSTNYPYSDITFALDTPNDDCYTALGGVGSWPYTLILDEDGIITYVKYGAFTEDELRTEIEKALKD